MTAIPEMVALFNGFGGLATFLIAWSQFNEPSNSMFPACVGHVNYLY